MPGVYVLRLQSLFEGWTVVWVEETWPFGPEKLRQGEERMYAGADQLRPLATVTWPIADED